MRRIRKQRAASCFDQFLEVVEGAIGVIERLDEPQIRQLQADGHPALFDDGLAEKRPLEEAAPAGGHGLEDRDRFDVLDDERGASGGFDRQELRAGLGVERPHADLHETGAGDQVGGPGIEREVVDGQGVAGRSQALAGREDFPVGLDVRGQLHDDAVGRQYVGQAFNE